MPIVQLRQPEWLLNVADGQTRSLEGVIQVLTAVDEQKNLRRACRKINVSYRHAWGLIRHASMALGAPLLHSVRGQGATLSPLGERLVWANKRVSARLSPALEDLASELEAEIRQAIASPSSAIRVHASHSFAMDALRDTIRDQNFPMEFRNCGSENALASLSHARCDIAGFHMPTGDLAPAVLESWRTWLRPRAHVLINFVARRQGIVIAAGNPKHIVSLSDLTRSGVRFVNRQQGSGTRLLLDLMLKRDGIDCRQIAGFDNVEFTHAAVGAYIASGMADAGLADETAASLFGLNFLPLLEERYFLACHTDALESRPIKFVREVLRTRQFRARLSVLPGIFVNACGSTISMTEAFPELDKRRSGAGRGAGARPSHKGE